VRADLDHKAYLPAAWRVDDYLELEADDDDLTSLRQHKLEFAKGAAAGPGFRAQGSCCRSGVQG
jgi:hypothetical protein